MPNPKTYRPLGNGMYEVTVGTRKIPMRIDPKKLNRAGYTREQTALKYMSAEDMLRAKLKEGEMMGGPERSRQWIEERWNSMQPDLNAPVRQATTTLQPPPQAPPPEPVTEYVLTEKGLQPSERGMWEPTEEEKRLREADTKAMFDSERLREREDPRRGKYM